jgi:protein gp37
MSPSKIEWCNETVNPQGWGCWGPGGTPDKPQRCWYCYVERQAKGPYVPDCAECRALIPHWHPERLEIPLKWRKPRRIFWQSMGDLMHPLSPKYQIQAVIEVAKATPQHSHIFCTKNAVRYQEFNPWPGNCILLTTITGLGDEEGRIVDLLQAEAAVRGLSLEPLLGPVNYLEMIPYFPDGFPGCINTLTGEWWPAVGNAEEEYRNRVQMNRLDLLIIGAMTGKGASRFVPARAWVQGLIDQGQAAGVPVFLKDNLRWPEKIQEWPLGF